MAEATNKKSKALILGTIIYAIGNFGTKILSFFIVPLYTYYINPSDLGDYDLLQTTIAMLTPLITLQISEGAYALMIKDVKNTEKYIVAVYKFLIITILLATGIILGINCFITIKYVYYFIALLITDRCLQTLQKLLRGLKNQKLFAISGVVYTVIFLLLNLLQIVVLKKGVIALFQSAIIADVVSIIIILIAEKRLRTFRFEEKSIELQKEMLKFSIPLIPNHLNWWIVSSSDRYIIKFFLGSAANGIYAIAYKFPSVLQLLYNMFYLSWQDTSLEDSEEDSGYFYTKVFKMYYEISFSFLIFLVPFTKIFIRIFMSSSYENAASYISFLYLGTVFQAYSSFFGVGYLKNKKTSKAATTSIYGAIVNAVINIVSIKFIGLHAASISTFLGFLLMFIVRKIQTKDIMNVKVNWSKFLLLFGLAFSVCCACVFSNMKVDAILSIVGGIFFIIINMKLIKTMMKKILEKARKKYVKEV